VKDAAAAFGPQVSYTDAAEVAAGRWGDAGAPCVDAVVLGCYNEGVCVAPNTCACAAGWTGADCSLPICAAATALVQADDLLPVGATPTSGWADPRLAGRNGSVPATLLRRASLVLTGLPPTPEETPVINTQSPAPTSPSGT
jgi:hypothetical protein